MTQHEQKPENAEFRTREEQIETMTVHYMEAGFPINAARRLARDGVAEAEARGAAEQRRRDAEGAEPVAWQYEVKGLGEWQNSETGYGPDIWRLKCGYIKPDQDDPDYRKISPLYKCPANVAALRDRIKEFEEAIAVLLPLVEVCEQEFTGPMTESEADESAVGASAEKDMAITFGHIRNARKILDNLKGEEAIREGGGHG